MQRVKSLRHSLSRKAKRRSGASITSSNADDSPRPSHDTGGDDSPSSSTNDLSSSPAASKDSKPDAAPKTAPPADVGDARKDAAANQPGLGFPGALSDSTSSDPPVMVDPPSPSPAEGKKSSAKTAAAATSGREGTGGSARERKESAQRVTTKSTVTKTETKTETKKKSVSPPEKKPAPEQRSWLALAVASGGFAALNGVFAKLTTAEVTTSIARVIALRLAPFANVKLDTVTPAVRGVFFALNLLSNTVMWALFTRALTAHPSATKVTLINTSANFLVTAVLGVLIFAEVLPASWFGGAALLVLGTLIIGRDRATGEAR